MIKIFQERIRDTEKRDRIWQRPFIERRRSEIQKDLLTTPAPKLLPILKAALAKRNYSGLLDAYLYAFEGSQTSVHIDFCIRVLEKVSISPQRSRLTYLYDQAYLRRSHLSSLEGNRWLAQWYARLSGQNLAPLKLERSFSRRRNLDSIKPRTAIEEQLDQLSRLRWSGRVEEARFFCEALLLPSSLPDSVRGQYDWLRTSFKMQLDRDEPAFGEAHRLAIRRETRTRSLEIYLWGLCLPSKKVLAWAGMPPNGKTPIYQFVAAMRAAHLTIGTLHQRLETIGFALDKVMARENDELRVMACVSAARYFLQNKQPALFEECFYQYQELSRQMSAGRSQDILGVFEEERPEPVLKKIPASRLQRWSAVGKMAFALSQLAAGHLVKSPFQSRANRKKKLDRDLAIFSRIAYRYTNEMKGAWMKLAQLASYLGPDLPTSARDCLAALQQDASPLESGLIEQIVKKELGKPVTELFAYWNPIAFATGSVGQVHRARTHAGEEIVVKVQYPKIESILENDLQSLSFLIPIIRPFFRHWDFNALLGEVRQRFLEECNYEKESENQQAFFRMFEKDPEIIVPRVLTDFSSSKVLTSQYIPGKKIRDFTLFATPEERNRAAEIMTRWHWRTIFKAKMFSGDPHPGNFLFLPNAVAFIDYGNVKRWEDPACLGIRSVMEGLLHDNFDLFAKGYTLAGMSAGRDEIVREEFSKIRNYILGYLREDRAIAFDQERAIEYFRRCTTANPNTRHSVKITSECAMLFKAHWSFFATVGQLNPVVNWRRVYLQAVGSDSEDAAA